MKSPQILLTMADGRTRTICASPVKEIRLDDRAFELFLAAIEGRAPEPLHSRLDGELALLREAVEVHEPNGEAFFAEVKRYLHGLDERVQKRVKKSEAGAAMNQRR